MYLYIIIIIISITTVLISVYFYFCSFHLFISFVHFICSFLHPLSGKVFHYARAPDVLVDFCFALFALAFFLSRLVAFPLLCLPGALNPCVYFPSESRCVVLRWSIPGAIALPGFLCILQVQYG